MANFEIEEILDGDYPRTFYVSVGLTTILAALMVRYFLCEKPMNETSIDITGCETEEDIQRNDDISEELEMNALDKGNAVEEKFESEEINVDQQTAIMKEWEDEIRKIHERMAEREKRMEELLKKSGYE